MKTVKNKIVVGILCLSAVFAYSSCCSTTYYVGQMNRESPAVCTNTIHNSHFLGGLVGSKDIAANEYLAGKSDYCVKTFHSFVDCLLGGITLGIYTPTTTKIYLPADGFRSK